MSKEADPDPCPLRDRIWAFMHRECASENAPALLSDLSDDAKLALYYARCVLEVEKLEE